MKTLHILSVLSLITVISSGNSRAQQEEWTVITIAPDTLRSCTIGEIEGNMVSFIRPGETVGVPVDSIAILFRTTGSHFWTGAGYGTLIGAGVGAFIGAVTYEEPENGWVILDPGRGGTAFLSGILGGVAGFAVGGLIGASSDGEERYDISSRTNQHKLIILRQLRDKH